jgi:L-methionine (R)-S-oxide reductase
MAARDEKAQQWLEAFLSQHGGVAGTVHRVRADDPDLLELVAAVNIPPKVQEVTATVPRGKGMAGLALERAQPVVALPVQAGGAVRAVVGIAYAGEREMDDAELQRLGEAAREVP